MVRVAGSAGIHLVGSHESSAIPCTHRVCRAAELTRVAGYVSRDASVRAGGPRLVVWLVMQITVLRALHIYAYLRVPRTCVRPTHRDTMDQSIYYCKSQKAWRNGALTSTRHLNILERERWQTTMVAHGRDLNSIARTQITTSHFSFSLSPPFSLFRSLFRATVIYCRGRGMFVSSVRASLWNILLVVTSVTSIALRNRQSDSMGNQRFLFRFSTIYCEEHRVRRELIIIRTTSRVDGNSVACSSDLLLFPLSRI